MANLKAAAVVGALIFGLYVAAQISPLRSSSTPAVNRSGAAARPVAPPETFRLVHAIGNSETESARGLSRRECESRKAELKTVATSLGTYNEAAGFGSIACLPESDF